MKCTRHSLMARTRIEHYAPLGRIREEGRHSVAWSVAGMLEIKVWRHLISVIRVLAFAGARAEVPPLLTLRLPGCAAAAPPSAAGRRRRAWQGIRPRAPLARHARPRARCARLRRRRWRTPHAAARPRAGRAAWVATQAAAGTAGMPRTRARAASLARLACAFMWCTLWRHSSVAASGSCAFTKWCR